MTISDLEKKAQDFFSETLDDKKAMAYKVLKQVSGVRHHLSKEVNKKSAIPNISEDKFCLYHIKEVTYEEKAPQKEAVKNIFGTFRGMKGINLLYCIIGDGKTIDFYIGVALTDEYNGEINASNFGRNFLGPSISGNFRGCKLESVNTSQKMMILDRLKKCNSVGMLEGVPSLDNQKENFQGTDRLIDVMQGASFGVVVIASPYSEAEMIALSELTYCASDILNYIAKYNIQKSFGANVNDSSTEITSYTEQDSYNKQTTDSDSHSYTEGEHHDHRDDMTSQLSRSSTESNSIGRSDNFSDVDNHSEKNGEHTWGVSKSGTKSSDNYQHQVATAHNSGSSVSDGVSKSNQHVNSDGTSTVEGYANNIVNSKSSNTGDSLGISISKLEQVEVDRKKAIEWIKYIDDVLLSRIDQGYGKGLFNVCTYLFSSREIMLYRLANTMISLYSGPKGNRTPLIFTELNDIDNFSNQKCLNAMQNFQIPNISKSNILDTDKIVNTLLSRKVDGYKEYRGNWMSAEELGILAGFPKKEVIGLSLREEVDFGLNVINIENEDRRLKIGKIVQCGVEKNDVYLDRLALDKHTFIAGVTGSGKTNTCQHILSNSKLPFLVIEPAKTEYRGLSEIMNHDGGNIIYFTPGKQKVAPFFLNPFELFPGEEISSRADMIKATFEASFDMEAAIPQIMEAAIYLAYEMRGWDIGTSKWRDKDENNIDGPFADNQQAFPTLSDFKAAVKFVIDKQGFDDRLRQEYLGSINARIDSLMLGAKGQMLNVSRSVDFYDLVDRQVVIELEEIKNGTEKSLLMGFILTNLLQAVKKRKKEKKTFQHITLIEEAHRLLSRYTPGDSSAKKQGVEVFSDMLAEVRKYGESLIIVDQIPDKMTPEVLKNTNTKIIHKLFAQDDKDAIGNTMALKDDQKAYLSNLQQGRAIVFSQGWTKAVQVQITDNKYSEKNMLTDEMIHDKSMKYYAIPSVASRCIFHSSENVLDNYVNEYINMRQESYGWMLLLKDAIAKKQLTDDILSPKKIWMGIRKLSNKYNSDLMQRYILSEIPFSYEDEMGQEEADLYECYVKKFLSDILDINYDDEAKDLIISLIRDISDT